MKTIEEQAREYAETKTMPECGYILTARNAFIAGAKAATRWIPVDEDLPDNQDTVLLCGINGYGEQECSTGYFHGTKSGFIDYSTDGIEVTHWLPIPPMPEK